MIIAILAGLLLPALGNARNAAGNSRCANVLKGYSQAGIFYAADENDYWVPPSSPAWYQRLAFRRYAGAGALPGAGALISVEDAFPAGMLCPASLATDGGTKLPQLSYGMSYDKNLFQVRGVHALKLSQLAEPSKSATWMDALDSLVYDKLPYNGENLIDSMRGRRAYRHRAGLNSGFYDGHVEFLARAEVESRWDIPEQRFNVRFTSH